MADGGHPALLRAGAPGSIAVAAAAMASGGIVGLPTETVYGIGVRPRLDALAALIAAKQRPQDKGIPVLIDGPQQVADLVVMGDRARLLAACFWPGPLTLVLPLRRPGLVPGLLTGGRATLAVRLPDHALPRALARRLGPIAVTSANRSGEPEARTAAELVASLGDSLAVVLDDGPVRDGVVSSVVAVERDGRVHILREGALGSGVIEAALAGG